MVANTIDLTNMGQEMLIIHYGQPYIWWWGLSLLQQLPGQFSYLAVQKCQPHKYYLNQSISE